MFFLKSQLYILVFFFIISIILSAFFLVASIVFSLNNPDIQKLSSYECGFDPYGDSRSTFNIHFYIVGLIFLIFDLETVFLLPWSIAVSCMTPVSYWGFLDFIFELLISFYYIWILGILNWK